MALADDPATLGVERREERGGPMAHVVVSPPLDLFRTHRQQWLTPVERLDQRLIIDAQHQGFVRRDRGPVSAGRGHAPNQRPALAA
jgi:hypothetical protein